MYFFVYFLLLAPGRYLDPRGKPPPGESTWELAPSVLIFSPKRPKLKIDAGKVLTNVGDEELAEVLEVNGAEVDEDSLEQLFEAEQCEAEVAQGATAEPATSEAVVHGRTSEAVENAPSEDPAFYYILQHCYQLFNTFYQIYVNLYHF